MNLKEPIHTIILTENDCARYPQPVFLAREFARAFGSCDLVDHSSIHRFTPDSEPAIKSMNRPVSRGMYLGALARFLRCTMSARPRLILGVNETTLAQTRLAASLAPRGALIGAYFLDYWEDDLAWPNTRLKLGHRAVAKGGAWLDFAIDCEPERLKRRHWLNAKRTSTFILRNAPPLAEAPAWNKPRNDPARIIYAGRNDPNGCVENIVTALTLLKSECQTHFYLTGHERRTEKLKAQAAELKLGEERLVFHAPVEKKILYERYMESDIGLCLYRSGEGIDLNAALCSPNKVYEYLASGLAVVASGNETLKFISESGLGVNVNPLDPADIARGIDETIGSGRYAEMGRRARELFETSLCYEIEIAPIMAWCERAVRERMKG